MVHRCDKLRLTTVPLQTGVYQDSRQVSKSLSLIMIGLGIAAKERQEEKDRTEVADAMLGSETGDILYSTE